MNAQYADASQRLSDLTAIEEALGILHWDQEIVMPPGATESRGRQISTLSVLAHERMTDPRLASLLETLANDPSLDDVQRANIREARRDQRRALRVPPELVRTWGQETVRAHDVWVAARKAADFGQFQPGLEKLVDLARQRAAAVDPDKPAYDVLLDEFEPGMTMAVLDPLFAQLKAFLVPFIARVRAKGAPVDTAWLSTFVPAETQRASGEAIVRAMGYAFDRGRLDTSVHPFCGGAGPTDVRITTRYNERAFAGSLLAMIHETGHALYEQGRDLDLADQPVSRPRSMGIHESQSLLWEKQVAQNEPFWQHHFPKLQQAYGFLGEVSLQHFVFGLNLVDFSNLIRVDADELTYPLHVILRYEIERDLFSGRLEVADLPRVWNQKMREYLDIEPADDGVGVLQDVHWSGGSFGYFPSYTLGALYAAQFYRKAVQDVPGLQESLAAGDPGPLREWLRVNVHQPGSRWETDELVRRATGETLNPEHFVTYAREKYSRLYGL
jgi:carboxypeptidase Taq